LNKSFRPQALAHVTDPDQLDQALHLVRPRHLLGFGVVFAVLLAALVWSLFATAPVKSDGQGVLLSPAGVAAITARDAGQIAELLVQPGEHVQADQAVAVIHNPARIDALRAAEAEYREAQDLYDTLAAEFASQDRLQADVLHRVGQAAAERMRTLDVLLVSLRKRRVGEAGLREKGMISERQLFETETQLAQTEHELATARNRITELALELEQQVARRQQELAEQRIRAQSLKRRAENLDRDYERNRQVRATIAGTLAEFAVDLDDSVASGQIIARLSLDGDTRGGLTAVAYLPAADGKKVKPGMVAHVVPSTVRFELDGYLLGHVSRVADLPASREALMRRLRNAVLVDEILEAGTPFEIEVELQTDPSTPSGYAWTSGVGPNIRLESGTLARVEVVVERVHLIRLLFPAMDYVYGWLKAL
jgi:HlyD family secretion protein